MMTFDDRDELSLQHGSYVDEWTEDADFGAIHGLVPTDDLMLLIEERSLAGQTPPGVGAVSLGARPTPH